jgi:anti-anti-sigma factor
LPGFLACRRTGTLAGSALNPRCCRLDETLWQKGANMNPVGHPEADTAVRREPLELAVRADGPDAAAESVPIATISITDLGDQVVVTLRGEFDLCAHRDIDLAFASVLDRAANELVVDLERLEFVDAHTLYACKAIAEQLAARGSVVVFRRPSPFVARLLDLAELPGSARVSA